MENWAYFAVVVTALAVVLQACILAALYISTKKTSERIEAIASDVQKHAVPVLQSAQNILADSQGKIALAMDNLAAVSVTFRSQAERIDKTLAETVDRSHMQMLRVDALVSRTMDKIEETTELVQGSIITPVRQVAGVIAGVTAGINAIMRRRKPAVQPQETRLDEEMFI